MNQAINICITVLNNLGQGFWNYAATIFIQSSLLILLLLIIDFVLRKRVRAVFRYCLWMLLFIKLILPASFTLPTGIGYWLGDYFTNEVSVAKLVPQIEDPTPIATNIPQAYIPLQTPIINETTATEIQLEPICWQGLVFLGWLVGMLVLLALLVQRVYFVKGLIAQAKPANRWLSDMLDECRCQIGIRRNIELKLSASTLSPAVCGLFNPIILMPASLLEKLSPEKLKAVLIHELAHIKRADVWVNLLGTMLQIVYFYNPLVWIANAMIRRVREQAVDEMVLVTLKPKTESYSNTLIDIAEMTFARPSFSLRLIGVVESKKALERRIKHMLNRPTPKSSKLGILGLFAIVVIGSIILPMSSGQAGQAALEKPVESSPKELNDPQRIYMEWTEEKFAGQLDRSEFADLSESTKAELEEKWIAILQAPRNKKYYNAINSLAAIKSKKAVKPLLKIAGEHREKDNRDRWMATRALGIVGDDSAVPELIHLVYHYNQNTRFWAQISLVRLTGENFGTDWQQWGKWWNNKDRKPAFSNEKIVWTTRYAEYADPQKQKESDKKFIERYKDKKTGKTKTRRSQLRENFKKQTEKDKELYTPAQLQEIWTLYRVANKKWNSLEAKESLRKLINKYPQSNRAGCAILYLSQMSNGREREDYLKTAIEKYNDCWYGDGVQVGAYARYKLAFYYQQIDKLDDANKLFKELIENYPNAVNHKGRLLSDSIPDSKTSKATDTTYIVSFNPIGDFQPQTAKELLDAFNEQVSFRVTTHHFRTAVQDNKLTGHILTNSKAEQETIATILNQSKKLRFANAKKATEEDLVKHYAMGQPSLRQGAKKAHIPSSSTINEQGHIVDKIDYPFVNDPDVIGGWKSVDYVEDIDAFDPTGKNWKGDLFLNHLIFEPNGSIAGNLLTWTKGLVFYNNDTVTASQYHIKEIDGSTYMFYQWKSGDYTFRHSKPSYYVLKKVLVQSLKYETMVGTKADIPPTSTINKQGHIVDKIDYPFINDPQIIGTWKSVDYVGEIEQFKLGQKQWKGRGGKLFLNEMIFLKNGRLISKNNKVPAGYPKTWTKGLVFYNNDMVTASKYHIKEIDGSAYIFFEWKSGDYSFRHQKPSYYVLKKVSSETSPLAQSWASQPSDADFARLLPERIEQLDIDTADLEQVKEIFGKPAQYIWGKETFTEDNLPNQYILMYPGNFRIYMQQNQIVELRHEHGFKYVYRDRLQAGSTLDEVFDVIGLPDNTIQGEKNSFADNVLYKDIAGRKGHCYYARSDQDLRLWFADYKLIGIYMTRSDYGTKKKPMAKDLLFEAIESQDISQIKQYLAGGADINARKDYYRAPDIQIKAATPLIVAMVTENIEIIELLLANGADVHAKVNDAPPLIMAIFKEDKRMVELFLANGADVNAKCLNGLTPLHCAYFDSNKEILDLLIANGADVNAKDDDGNLPSQMSLELNIFSDLWKAFFGDN